MTGSLWASSSEKRRFGPLLESLYMLMLSPESSIPPTVTMLYEQGNMSDSYSGPVFAAADISMVPDKTTSSATTFREYLGTNVHDKAIPTLMVTTSTSWVAAQSRALIIP